MSGHGGQLSGPSYRVNILTISVPKIEQAYDFATADPLKPQTIVAVEGLVIQGLVTTAPSRDSSLSGYEELCAPMSNLNCEPTVFGRLLVSAARERLFNSDFGMCFCGCYWEAFGPSDFIAPITGCQMGHAE